jgi:hypothetical protein
MQIALDNATLTVVSPSGQPLVRGTVTAEPVRSFRQVLTETGDYQVYVSIPADSDPVNYVMNVSITGEAQRQTSSERIRFPTGAISAQVVGQVSGNESDNYVLFAAAGQTMQVDIDAAFLTLVSPSGSPLARAENSVQHINQTLPESGDYSLRVSLPVGSASVNYTLSITITGAGGTPSSQRIRFQTGATSAQVAGQVSGNEVDSYVLEAFAGQTMQVDVDSAYLTLVSPSGEPLARAQNGAQHVSHELPESGDYLIQISVPIGSGTVAYTLTVSIVGEPSRVTSSERIRFASGSTSALLTGRVSGSAQNSFAAHAIAGQRMQITISSGTLTVVSPSGQPLVRGTVTAQPVRSFSQALTETGDYLIYVSAPAGSGAVNYTLNIAVTR